MGKMGRACCMICGKELPIEDMKATFTGRTQYRCYECIANGEKQVSGRISESCTHGYVKKLRERNRWR